MGGSLGAAPVAAAPAAAVAAVAAAAEEDWAAVLSTCFTACVSMQWAPFGAPLGAPTRMGTPAGCFTVGICWWCEKEEEQQRQPSSLLGFSALAAGGK